MIVGEGKVLGWQDREKGFQVLAKVQVKRLQFWKEDASFFFWNYCGRNRRVSRVVFVVWFCRVCLFVSGFGFLFFLSKGIKFFDLFTFMFVFIFAVISVFCLVQLVFVFDRGSSVYMFQYAVILFVCLVCVCKRGVIIYCVGELLREFRRQEAVW